MSVAGLVGIGVCMIIMVQCVSGGVGGRVWVVLAVTLSPWYYHAVTVTHPDKQRCLCEACNYCLEPAGEQKAQRRPRERQQWRQNRMLPRSQLPTVCLNGRGGVSQKSGRNKWTLRRATATATFSANYNAWECQSRWSGGRSYLAVVQTTEKKWYVIDTESGNPVSPVW